MTSKAISLILLITTYFSVVQANMAQNKIDNNPNKAEMKTPEVIKPQTSSNIFNWDNKIYSIIPRRVVPVININAGMEWLVLKNYALGFMITAATTFSDFSIFLSLTANIVL